MFFPDPFQFFSVFNEFSNYRLSGLVRGAEGVISVGLLMCLGKFEESERTSERLVKAFREFKSNKNVGNFSQLAWYPRGLQLHHQQQ